MSIETKTKRSSVDQQPNETSKKQKRIDKKKEKQKEKRYVRRIVPIWAKLLIIVVLSLFALMIGLVVGFSIIGDGDPLEVLKWETWQHIINFVKEK